MIRGCAAMAGMNQRNNDCTVYTHRVAQTDFRRSLRMVRLILTEQKRATTWLPLWYLALHLVIYGSQGQRGLTLLRQRMLLINPPDREPESVSGNASHTASCSSTCPAGKASVAGRESHRETQTVRMCSPFLMNVRCSAPQPQNDYCLIQSSNNRVLFMVNNISAQRLHLEGSTHSATLLKRLLSKTLKSAAGRVCFHPRPFVGR